MNKIAALFIASVFVIGFSSAVYLVTEPGLSPETNSQPDNNQRHIIIIEDKLVYAPECFSLECKPTPIVLGDGGNG